MHRILVFCFLGHAVIGYCQLLPSVPTLNEIIGWPTDSPKKSEQNYTEDNVIINYTTGTVTVKMANFTYNYFQGSDGRIICYP